MAPCGLPPLVPPSFLCVIQRGHAFGSWIDRLMGTKCNVLCLDAFRGCRMLLHHLNALTACDLIRGISGLLACQHCLPAPITRGCRFWSRLGAAQRALSSAPACYCLI